MEEKIKLKNPSLHRYLFTVTTFSKLLAMFLFILLPFLGFYLGMQYQQKITAVAPAVSEVQKIPTPSPTLILSPSVTPNISPKSTALPQNINSEGNIYTTENIDTSGINTNGWKSLFIPNEKLTLQYPSTWTVMQQNMAWPTYYLISPNNFVLGISTDVGGLGGACPSSTCLQINIPNIDIGTLNFYKQPLYIVVNGPKTNINPPSTNTYIQFNVITSKDCFANICYGFWGENSSGTVIIIGRFIKNISALNTNTFFYADDTMQPDQFINSGDVKTAVAILKTLHY
jgi:hypothetical protein